MKAITAIRDTPRCTHARWQFTGFLTALLMLLCVRSSYAEPVRTIQILGDASYFPYAYSDGTQMKGFYSELIERVASRLPEYRIELVPMPWKRGLRQMEKGDAFAIYPPYRFERERPYIHPYSAPLFNEAIVIFCREDRLHESFTGLWPDDYTNMSLATNLGFTLAGDEFWQPIKAGKVKHAEFRGNRDSLTELIVHGSVDCYANDRQSILANQHQLQKHFEKASGNRTLASIRETSVILEQQAFIGYSRTYSEQEPWAQAFIRDFDNALRAYQQSREYAQFAEQYWQMLAPE